MPGGVSLLPDTVGQTNEKSAHSTERASKINTVLRKGNLLSLSHSTPTPLNQNHGINLWVWILKLNTTFPKTPFSTPALMASSPIPLDAFKSFFCFPQRSCVFCFLCSEDCLYNCTIIETHNEKYSLWLIFLFLYPTSSKISVSASVWSLLGLIPDSAGVKHFKVILYNRH